MMDDIQAEEKFSIEIKGSGGARKSTLCLSSDLISFPPEAYDEVETAWEVLERACRLYGNNRCFGWRSSNSDYTWINYNDFAERARHFGCGLVHIGMTPGQGTFIGIYGTNSIEWSVAQYGCFSQSAAIISLNDGYGVEVMVKTINRSEVEFIICDDVIKARTILLRRTEIPTVKHIIINGSISEELAQLAVSGNICLHSYRDVEESGRQQNVPESPPVSSDVYIVCFTSGTTGDPKGVVMTHKYFVCGSSSVLKLMASRGMLLSETDVMMSHLSINHAVEHILEGAMMLVGGCIGYYSGDYEKLFEDIQTLQPTLLPAVPLLLNQIYDKLHFNNEVGKPRIETLQLENKDETSIPTEELLKQCKSMLGGNLRIILSAASNISDKVSHFFRFGLGCQVMDFYGQSECGGICLRIVERNTAAGGILLPSVMVKLKDVPDLGYFASNMEGEICVKGHTIFKHYLKNPSKTAEAMDSEGWVHTEDIGRILPDGSLKVVDRITNIFKITNGYYITPVKIELIYSRSKYVAQVVVYGDSMKDYLVSIVVPEKTVVEPYMKDVLKCEATWHEMCKHPILKELILKDMRQFGDEAGLFPFEQVRAVHLHPDPLTHRGGQLTSTLKIRRRICNEIFKSVIEAMYRETDAMKHQCDDIEITGI